MLTMLLLSLAGLLFLYVIWEASYKRRQASKASSDSVAGQFALPKPPQLPANLAGFCDRASDRLNEALAQVDAQAKAARAKLLEAAAAQRQATTGDPVAAVAASLNQVYARLQLLPQSPERDAAIISCEAAIGPTMLAAVKGATAAAAI